MSVSSECKVGENDVIYIIDDFIDGVLDKNGFLDIENSINHKIGDRVYFLDWYYEMVGDNQYTKIKYKDENGRIFSAVETLFVTEDGWENLKTYFRDYFAKNE